MAKTRRLRRESLGLCDGAGEKVDARVTISGRNPEIEKLLEGKPRIILLNKADLADADTTARRVVELRREGTPALAVDCRSGRGLNAFNPLAREVCAEQVARNESKGMSGRALRLMVVGIPNCGKSSFINRMAGRVKAEAADRPGVTRRTSWFSGNAGRSTRTYNDNIGSFMPVSERSGKSIAIGDGLEFLDTPGVLWPKFEDPVVGLRLAFIGSVKDEILDIEELACAFLNVMRAHYAVRLEERYSVDCAVYQEDDPFAAYALLEDIARSRGFLLRGNEADTIRASRTLMDEYRAGKLGRITLD